MSVLRIPRTTRGFRRLGLIVTAVVVGFSTSGCSDHVGSGVVVGDVAVSETTVQQQASQVIAESSPVPAFGSPNALKITRSVATNAIRHQLVQRAAAQNGISVDEAQISATLTQIGEGLAQTAATLQVPQSDVDDFIRDLAVLQQLLAKLPPEGVEIDDVTMKVDVVNAPTRDAAVAQRSRYLSHPATMDADIAAAGSDGAVGADVSLLTQPSLAPTGLFNAQQGDVVLVATGNEDKYLVIRVTGRVDKRAPLTAAAVPQDNPANAITVLSLMLTPYAQQAGVTVNPRYGLWDAAAMQVVPGDSGV